MISRMEFRVVIQDNWNLFVPDVIEVSKTQKIVDLVVLPLRSSDNPFFSKLAEAGRYTTLFDENHRVVINSK